MAAYQLELTDADIDTIAFVGGRYEWSDALRHLEPGVNELTEGEAWALAEAFEADTEGGHSYFPLLDSHSDLAGKLMQLLDAIV